MDLGGQWRGTQWAQGPRSGARPAGPSARGPELGHEGNLRARGPFLAPGPYGSGRAHGPQRPGTGARAPHPQCAPRGLRGRPSMGLRPCVRNSGAGKLGISEAPGRRPQTCEPTEPEGPGFRAPSPQWPGVWGWGHLARGPGAQAPGRLRCAGRRPRGPSMTD